MAVPKRDLMGRGDGHALTRTGGAHMSQDEHALTRSIGQRLRAQRQAVGLSLSELAQRTGGLSKSRISNYEQGIRRMGLEEAEALATALGTVTPAYLLGLEGEGPITGDEYALLEAYRRVSAELQGAVRRILCVD